MCGTVVGKHLSSKRVVAGSNPAGVANTSVFRSKRHQTEMQHPLPDRRIDRRSVRSGVRSALKFGCDRVASFGHPIGVTATLAPPAKAAGVTVGRSANLVVVV